MEPGATIGRVPVDRVRAFTDDLVFSGDRIKYLVDTLTIVVFSSQTIKYIDLVCQYTGDRIISMAWGFDSIVFFKSLECPFDEFNSVDGRCDDVPEFAPVHS